MKTFNILLYGVVCVALQEASASNKPSRWFEGTMPSMNKACSKEQNPIDLYIYKFIFFVPNVILKERLIVNYTKTRNTMYFYYYY